MLGARRRAGMPAARSEANSPPIHAKPENGVLLRDDCMDAGGRVTQKAKAEYALHHCLGDPLPRINVRSMKRLG